jgi:CRISPR-associated protein Csd1
MRFETAERAAAALNWLLRDQSSCLRLGGGKKAEIAVFWAAPVHDHQAKPQAVGFAELMAEADSLEVRDFLQGPWAAHFRQLEEHRFYAAILSSPQSRITIRSWLTETLAQAQAHLKRWFASLALPACYAADVMFVSIPELAGSTVPKSKKNRPLPTTYTTLFEAALFGEPLPPKLLAAALGRQSLELAKGSDKKNRNAFERRLTARTALIKLYFELTKGVPMPPENHDLETNSGYLCGRLLAILDKIHQDAHWQSGGTNTSPANRVYGAASTTPALVFPQLCKMVRYHLNKIGGGWAYCLEHGYTDPPFEGLAAICAKLRHSAGQEFPKTLSLEDQGRFAIGFYYERCRVWPKPKKKQDEEQTVPVTTSEE